MTNEEMRKAIAAHLGWKLYQINFAMRSWAVLKEPGFNPGELDATSEVFEVGWEACEHLPFAWDNVPNWPEDLNAMHEAEQQGLKTQEEKMECGMILLDVCAPGEPVTVIYAIAVIACATAHQRAEAFLRTVGKWKEVQ